MYGALSYLTYLWNLGFGQAKRRGDALKSSFVVLMGKWWGWGGVGVLTMYQFYRIYLFPIFLLFDLFYIYYRDWQGHKCKLKCLKVYEINSELYCNCNCHSPFLWFKHHYPKTSQEYICCNWKSIVSKWSFSEIKKCSI